MMGLTEKTTPDDEQPPLAMPPIAYDSTTDIDAGQLQSLFASVQWDSANYPDKLAVAIRNSHRVFTAWDGDQLVGLMNALSDGVMTAYFHYLLVRPEYHKMNIGRTLVKMMLDEYADYARKVLIAYAQETHFYKQCGFEIGDSKVPMFVTYLKT